MINISLNKGRCNYRENPNTYNSLQKLLPVILQLNKEIVALNKLFGTKIKFQIQISDVLTVEVKDA